MSWRLDDRRVVPTPYACPDRHAAVWVEGMEAGCRFGHRWAITKKRLETPAEVFRRKARA